jgi:ABC-type uncharacterized transport system substrate-binding protein
LDGKYHYARFPVLADKLITIKMRMLVEAARPTLPIVFTTGRDPVKLDLVASVVRLNENATGLAIRLELKRLELLRELARAAAVLAQSWGQTAIARRT